MKNTCLVDFTEFSLDKSGVDYKKYENIVLICNYNSYIKSYSFCKKLIERQNIYCLFIHPFSYERSSVLEESEKMYFSLASLCPTFLIKSDDIVQESKEYKSKMQDYIEKLYCCIENYTNTTKDVFLDKFIHAFHCGESINECCKKVIKICMQNANFNFFTKWHVGIYGEFKTDEIAQAMKVIYKYIHASAHIDIKIYNAPYTGIFVLGRGNNYFIQKEGSQNLHYLYEEEDDFDQQETFLKKLDKLRKTFSQE